MVEDLVYGWEPTVIVFADSAAAQARASALVAAVGARLARRAPLAEALHELEQQSAHAVLVHAEGADADLLAAVLERLQIEASSRNLPSVAVLDGAALDLAAALAPHPDVSLIVDGTDADAAVALGLAVAARTDLVLEERSDDTPMQLRRVREEVGRIARALAEISGEEARQPARQPAMHPPPQIGEVPPAAALRRLIRARRQREAFFPPDLFADPAWDMLLDLMLARMEGRLVAVSSLCIAAAVPPTTALRWIKRLTDEGLFIRAADPRDGRRIFIDLSEDCAGRMAAYLRAYAAGLAS